MKLKKLEVENFRCLKNLSLTFEDGLTIVVGENDSGKSSLIECLKVVTQNRNVDADDFFHDSNNIRLSIEIDNFLFERVYEKNESVVKEVKFIAKPSQTYSMEVRNTITALNPDSLTSEDETCLKTVAREFQVTVRNNSRPQTLKDNILELVDKVLNGEEVVLENVSFPKFNNIQLDGTQFENVTAFFREVFLKEKQASIWKEKINDKSEITIEEFVRDKIDSYSNEITKMIVESGVFERMQLFLRDVSDIKVEPIYESRDLNINAKVKFLKDGREVNIEKKGDGTKRRITMALLEFKKDKSLLTTDANTIYLLDEPDTHLHVKAQLELLKTLEGFAQQGHQVICSTHSPFIINTVSPKQIRMLVNEGHESSLRGLKHNSDTTNGVLKALGVENTYLFFARSLIIVEGQTEEHFIPTFYQQNYGRPLSSELIKIINIEGINNIIGFTRAILELHNRENVYLLYDNDISKDLSRLIDKLKINHSQKFVIGHKEFEDAFESHVLYRCWCNHLGSRNKSVPNSWTQQSIEKLKSDCRANGTKFSGELSLLNTGSGISLKKPILGKVLGEFIQAHELPETLNKLFGKLSILP